VDAVGAETAIQWCDHTFNPWIGCTKVSEGCRNCYAEAQNRFRKWNGGEWGPGAPRKRTSASNWRLPEKWNREAERAGQRARVFCASLADVFDDEAPAHWRADLFDLIGVTPHLDWQLLTKRPQNAARMLPWRDGEAPWRNVWIGTSVEDQRAADERIEHLMRTPATVRFLSCEPLLERIDLAPWFTRIRAAVLGGSIDWVIVGGESGGGAREMRLDWAQRIVNDCKAAGVAVFVKQLGAKPVEFLNPWKLRNHKGGDPAEWPADLRVREFPT
jgi:protein gp37